MVTPEGYQEGQIAGFIGTTAMFLIGVIMIFYREPLI